MFYWQITYDNNYVLTKTKMKFKFELKLIDFFILI